ncbi:hypothetical protein VP501E541_P0160 [Vibrio phage 501E54-1]|nr:hypothetical protein VP501E541_P0160 [Vibrio phage 501E54-1]
MLNKLSSVYPTFHLLFLPQIVYLELILILMYDL